MMCDDVCGSGRDGATQEAGSCSKDFRNKPNRVKLRIIYLRGMLEVGHVTCWCGHVALMTPAGVGA